MIRATVSQVPVGSDELASALNSLSPEIGGEWRGEALSFPSDDWEALARALTAEGPWAAMFYTMGLDTGHFVVVDGYDDGELRIKDPFDQVSYTMTIEEFLAYWNLYAIRWRKS